MSKGSHISIMHCDSKYDTAAMDMIIAVGFGIAYVSKNGQIIYDEKLVENGRDFWTTQDAENEARKDPDNDWRIVLSDSLIIREYQRQGDNNWVLVYRERI